MTTHRITAPLAGIDPAAMMQDEATVAFVPLDEYYEMHGATDRVTPELLAMHREAVTGCTLATGTPFDNDTTKEH